jgi:carbon monoxide dehydrogenase subunit G
MELTGERLLPLARERVWDALNDPEILKVSVPGCESLERVDDTHYKVVMAAAVGPVKARFNGKLTLTDLRAPESYSLSFEGSGGAAGFGKGTAQVELAPEGTGTRLVYRANAQVGGRLAQVGARLIDGVAKKMAEEFFGRFTDALTPPAQPDAAASASADAQQPADAGVSRAAAPAPALAPAGSGNKVWMWATAAVVVLVLIAYHFH